MLATWKVPVPTQLQAPPAAVQRMNILNSEARSKRNAMKPRRFLEPRLTDTKRPADAMSLEAFSAILRKLHKDDQVSLSLIDGTSLAGTVDLISIHGDVMWLITAGGRQMFIPDDVNEVLRSTAKPPVHERTKFS
ncbi:hypothetical protein AUT26_08570 [[Arthrobacter] sp. ATCC 21022]|nr:hypothetical protein AUT26_08570 [Arthrobacter sp. ATCC 21022]KUR63472.1 hypothetical protein JM67_17185 [Arthrobacter sp. ATCC 21022]